MSLKRCCLPQIVSGIPWRMLYFRTSNRDVYEKLLMVLELG